MRYMILVALLASACGGSSTAPTPPSAPLPIVLSGQSNALMDHLGGPLVAAYPSGVAVVAQGSTAIREWDNGRPLWQELEPTLKRPLAAFVWWQGESDAQEGSEHYDLDLRAFLGRVRAVNGNPHLPIVLVQILDYAPPPPLREAAPIRAVQEAYVASDRDSVLVRIDDIQSDGGPHLKAGLYSIAADRVLAAANLAPMRVR